MIPMATAQSPVLFRHSLTKQHKNSQFSNAFRNYSYQSKITKLCELITDDSPSLADFKNIFFMGWVSQLLGRDKQKNKAKTGKMPDFPGL